MRKPRVVLEFAGLKHSTEKANLLVGKDGREVWIPKSISKIISTSSNLVKVLVAPFKYEELTGNEIQLLDVDIGWRRPVEMEPPIDVAECYKLLPEQRKAVSFLLNRRKSALFAETRTGKTIISLTLAKSRQEAGLVGNLVVICPVRIMAQWERYCQEFGIDNFFVFGAEHFSNEFKRDDVENALATKINESSQIIIDDSHLFKNHSCERTGRIVSAIGGADCYKIIMSGTPIGKHMGDLYSQFEMLDKSILNYSSYGEFERMHLLFGGSTGRKVVGYVNIEEFAYSLEPYIYRLKREDVLQDRKVNSSVVYFDLDEDERSSYFERLKKLKEYEERGMSFNILGELVRLQMIVSSSRNRIKKLMEFKDRRPVIFYKYDVEGELVKEKLNFPVLSGKTKSGDFLKFVSDYNEMRIGGLIVNQSLATGFDLGTADTVIFYSSVFDMIQKSQATDRVMNMFNESPVDVIEICCRDSIDEQIANVLGRKLNVKKAFYRELARLNKSEGERNEED